MTNLAAGLLRDDIENHGQQRPDYIDSQRRTRVWIGSPDGRLDATHGENGVPGSESINRVYLGGHVYNVCESLVPQGDSTGLDRGPRQFAYT